MQSALSAFPPRLLLLLLLTVAQSPTALVAAADAVEPAAEPAAPPPLTQPPQDDEAAAQQHHEAFLGKEQEPEFNSLSPDEAKKKLIELVHRLDTNHDGSVSFAEMENWLRDVAREERNRLALARFRALKEASGSQNPLAPLKFAEYERAMQKEMSLDAADAGAVAAGGNATGPDLLASHASMMARSRKRWAKADASADGALTAAELADFLRPEESPRMREVVVQEALGNTDTNGDGRLDMGEYLRDLYPEYDRDRREGKKLPDWVAKEEVHFRERLDLDKNGNLDMNEIYRFALPDTADHAKTEAKYLFEEADGNKDKFLSEAEVLKNWNIFVGHGATNFGAFDHPQHQEL